MSENCNNFCIGPIEDKALYISGLAILLAWPDHLDHSYTESPIYGTNPKSVDSKVFAINELKLEFFLRKGYFCWILTLLCCILLHNNQG